MSTQLKVLFAVDFKDGCEKAMHDLLKIARYRPMEIMLLHVFNHKKFEERNYLFPEAVEKLNEAQDAIKQKIEDKLDDWALRVMGPSFYQARVEFGEPAEVFSKYSKIYDVLVVGANKHGILDRVFFNSVSENIIGRTHMPTMILRKQLNGSQVATVLVDMADNSKSFIQSVLLWAKSMRLARVNFLAYYPVPIEVSIYSIHSAVILPELEIEKLMSDLKSGLENIIRSFEVDIEFDVNVKRTPASSLASNIAEDCAQINQPVIIGRRQRSKMSEFFLGSVALSLLRSTENDLIILPIKE